MHFRALLPAHDLLADLAADVDDVRSIFLPGGTPELLDELALLHPTAKIHWVPLDSRHVFVGSGDVVVHNDASAVDVAFRSIDLCVVEVTGDRSLARRWIALARQVARPDGVLLLAGANDDGIKPAIGDAAEAVGTSVQEDYRRHNRVAQIAIPSVLPPLPGWAEAPGIAPGTWGAQHVVVDDIDVVLETLPGVFSADALDPGTALLLEHLAVPADGAVLDVGCGAGAIGVVAGLLEAGSVTMTDVNLLAIAAARRNAGLIPVPTRVLAGDVYDPVGDERFDLIVSNPPFHQGRDIDHDVPMRLITGAKRHLNPGGRLVLVANAFLPYDAMMLEHFARVDTIATTRQFKVLSASA